MKKITCLIILFISLFVVTSCSKDENNSPNNNIEGKTDDYWNYRTGNVVDEYCLFAELSDNYDEYDEYFNFIACIDIINVYSDIEDLNDFSDKFAIYAENSESLGYEEEMKINSNNFKIVTEWIDYSGFSTIDLPNEYSFEYYNSVDYFLKVSVPRQLFKGNPNENSFIRLGIIEKQDDEYKQKSQNLFVYQKDENGLLNKSEMFYCEDEILEDEFALTYKFFYNYNQRNELIREIIQSCYISINYIIDNDDIEEYNVSEFDEENNLFNIPVYYKKSKSAPLKNIDGYAIGVENLFGDNNVEGYEKVGNSYLLYEFDSFIDDGRSDLTYKGYYTLPVEIIETNIDKCFFKQILYAIVDGEYYVVDYVYYESIVDYYYVEDMNILYIGYSLSPIYYYDYYGKDAYERSGKWMEEYNNADEVIKFFGY